MEIRQVTPTEPLVAASTMHRPTSPRLGWTGIPLRSLAQVVTDNVASVLEPLGIGASHFTVLSLLADGDPVDEYGLSVALLSDLFQTRSVINELQVMGLIERETLAQHGQEGRICISLSGMKVLRDAAQATARADDVFLAPLTPQDRQRFHHILAQLSRYELDRRLVSLFDSPASRVKEVHPYGLTDREMDVLRLVTSGKTNQEIADDMGIRLTTVKSHVSNLLSKTGVRSRTELVATPMNRKRSS